MPYLLDTCAISELAEVRPNARVVQALLALPRHELYLSVITIGEINYGIELLPPSSRRDHLVSWFEQSIIAVFADHTYSIDSHIALRWGVLTANLRRRALTMQAKDSLIAATALTHDLILVTRNVSDFAHSGVQIINPWK